ncbi:MAG: type secretion system protein [Rhodocyclaceae bacterium]|nr:type secretion system protein [Rhodocyclaceae bacterium]
MGNLQIVYLVLIFFAVTSGVFGIAAVFFRPRVAPERLKGKSIDSTEPAGGQWQATAVKLAEPVAKLMLPESGIEYSRLRTRFMNAGFRGRSAIPIYFAAKIGLTFLLPLLLATYVTFSDIKIESGMLMVYVLIAAGSGFVLPNLVLGQAVRLRQRELFEAFPDAIDLLVVCMEAGLGLDAAIVRAGEEMRVRSQELADELHLVNLELRVGATREQALRNLAMRTGLEDAASLATILIQADRFGTNVADALRVHADSQRVHRQMLAEEAAAKVPVKLVFPVVACIFPSLMLVMGGPPFISIYRNLFPALG